MGNEHFLADYCHHIGYRKPDNVMMQNRIKTNMRKYGVPYYCMTNDFIEDPAKGSNSKPNVSFDKLLTAAGIEHSREFPLGNYVYDFKIENTLVEINPTATHNSDKGAFGKPRYNRKYEWELIGYCSIRNVIGGAEKLFGESNGKGTSNEELMLKNGFLRVYDCGQATYVWTPSD